LRLLFIVPARSVELLRVSWLMNIVIFYGSCSPRLS
jgi:hypothetical protein